MGRPLSLRACIGTMNRSDSDRGGPRPQRSLKDESVSDFPGVLARATRCDRGPVAVRYFGPANSRAKAGSWVGPTSKIWTRIGDHEPDNAVGARLCEPQRVATSPSSAAHRPAFRQVHGEPLSLRACIGTMNLRTR